MTTDGSPERPEFENAQTERILRRISEAILVSAETSRKAEESADLAIRQDFIESQISIPSVPSIPDPPLLSAEEIRGREFASLPESEFSFDAIDVQGGSSAPPPQVGFSADSAPDFSLLAEAPPLPNSFDPFIAQAVRYQDPISPFGDVPASGPIEAEPVTGEIPEFQSPGIPSDQIPPFNDTLLDDAIPAQPPQAPEFEFDAAKAMRAAEAQEQPLDAPIADTLELAPQAQNPQAFVSQASEADVPQDAVDDPFSDGPPPLPTGSPFDSDAPGEKPQDPPSPPQDDFSVFDQSEPSPLPVGSPFDLDAPAEKPKDVPQPRPNERQDADEQIDQFTFFGNPSTIFGVRGSRPPQSPLDMLEDPLQEGERHTLFHEDDDTILKMADRWREADREFRKGLMDIFERIIADLHADNARLMTIVRHFQQSRRSIR